MQTAKVLERRTNLLYPLMVIAAATVIVFSIVGTATLMGWLPGAQSGSDPALRSETAGGTEGAAAAPRPRGAGAASAPVTGTHACADCGVIESIRVLQIKGEGSGFGAATGGVVGGILGNQVGRGNGRTVMTVVGAGAGAYAGHEIEKNVKGSTRYEIRVRMSDGSYRTFYQQSQPALGPGQKVRVTERGLAAAG